MKKPLKLLWIIIPLVILFIIIPIPSLFADPESESTEGNQDGEIQETKKQEAQIAVFGDIMLHNPQLTAGKKGDGYDFTSFFTDIKPYLKSADLAVGNFELTLGGPSMKYSGYPMFNAPDEIVDALLESGVDAVSTANNHSMDTREAGVRRTVKVLQEKKLPFFGTAASQQQRDTPLILETNGMKIAFLAYTEHTNGLPVPQKYLVNTIKLDLIKQDIAKAKEMGAEFVSVSLHWGQEYQREPNKFQEETAQAVLEAGADVIVGSHPHVTQPMKKVNINGKEKLIIYSLGNFVSNQTNEGVAEHTQEGMVVYFNIARDQATKEVKLKDVSFLPTYVHIYPQNGIKNYRVLPLTSENPTKLPNYPGLTKQVWKEAYLNTQQQMTVEEAFPTFSLK
ncbi:CapA family protein [Risungbinella massiliensis]|uniref:CapA family protein n=1 Tax=Risungbinella massiliensis TaxID=1329796 RepID=UPI00069C058B|nr:CapA family protein [Risungbinella massiliensis]